MTFHLALHSLSVASRAIFSACGLIVLSSASLAVSLSPSFAHEGRSSHVVANAGHDRHASVGETIQLDASGSQSFDGQPLSYAWSVVSRPSGSAATLSDASALRPKFTVDVAGDYVFALTARVAGDATAVAANAQISVSTLNVAPVADAGLNRRVTRGATVALDGAKSYDADGDAIAYSWTLVKKPYGSAAALSSAVSVRPALRIDLSGTYVAELIVTDSGGRRSAPVRVAFSTRSEALAGRASAGPSQSLALGATARLDADGTYLPGGAQRDAANAAWALLALPASSAATLATGADARQSLTVDAAGDYVVQAMMRGAEKCGDDDDFDDHHFFSQRNARLATTLITTGNVAPVADAGREQRFSAGAAVTLDGSRSTDVNGDLLTYRWALISRPPGSSATLDDANSIRPKFVADVAGTYVAQLIVDDGHGTATAATVVATSEASRPIADAGADPLGRAGAAVALNGSGSVDPKVGALAANWTILGLGDQPTVGSLSASTTLTTNFNLPAAGVPLTRAIFIEPASLPLAKGEQENGGPRGVDLDSVGRITKDGTPYTVWRIRNVTKNGRVATLDSEGTTFSVTLTIPAKSDLFVVSPIVAGTATHRLMANRQVYEVVDAMTTTFADTRLVGGGPALKLSIVQLAVANDLLFDVDDVVVSTVEARPVSVLSATTPAHRGGVVQLDGSGSLKSNAPSAIYSGLTYNWALLSRPAGSHAALSDVTAAIASFTPDAYGRYVAQLIVDDGALNSRPRTIVIDVAPRKPIAVASAASPVAIGQVATLDGAGSIDPDGNALSYAWTLIGKPAGSQASLSFATAAIASFSPDVAGTYVAELVVSDAYGVSAPAHASVVAQGGLAFTTPIGPQQVPLGGSLAFTVRAVDPTGKPVAYSIAGGLPAGASFDAATGAFRFRPPSNNPASHSFVFHATNGRDLATMTVPVTVTGEPSGTTSALSAKLYDAVDYANGTLTPIVGAMVASEALSATSGAGGEVALAGLPPGQTTLVISAASAALAPDGSRYLDTMTSASLIAGVTNTLDGPILLARSSGGTGVNPGGATTVTNAGLNVSLTIAPNSAFNADGTPYAGEISIGSLPSNTPAGLPAGFVPCQLLVISPAGVTFNPPAKLTVANRDQLPPGALVDLWAFDPQLATARVVGIGRVSVDGATIATEIGGIPGGSVVAMTPRRAGLAQIETQPKDIVSPSVLGGGDLATSFSPPGTRQLNAGRGLTFVYHSMTANPRPVIDTRAQLGPGQGLPQTLTTRLSVAGVTQQTVLSTNLFTPLNGGSALDPSRQNAILQVGLVDASDRASGAYPYSFLTISKYACSAVGSQSQGTVFVNNQTKSPFGAGWQLAETQKLEKQPDGSVAIVEGNGRAVVHHGSQAPDFLPDPVYVPVSSPFLGTVADLSGGGKPSLLRLGWKDGTLNAILNRGDRRFVKSSVLTVGQPGTQNANGTLSLDITDIAAGDINGDGAADAALITSRTSQAKIYYGASGGVFLPSPVQVESNTTGGNVVIGDWIGNKITHPMMSEGAGGYPDFHIILNDGRGSLVFKHDAPRLPGDPLAMVTVRFPGFAHDSVAGLTSDGTIGWAYGGAVVGAWYDKAYTRGVGSTEMYANGPLDFNELLQDGLRVPGPVRQTIGGRYLAAGDIDGTGYPGFAVAGVNAVYIVKWRGPGANNQKIAQTLTLPNGLAPDSVALAPLAKGDRPSLIVTANAAGFYVFTNDGRGNFSPTPVFIQTPFRVGIEADVADFDGDGISDIALNDIDNDRVAIFFGKPHPTGAFVSPIGDYTRLVKNANGTYSRIYNDGTVVAFNGEGFQTSITDANGNVTSFSYSSSGQLLSIVDPTGATTSFTYSGPFLASTTDGSGRTTSFEHDGAGNLTKVIDPLGNVTQYLYDANHQLIATIDPNGGRTGNEFTSTGQLKKQTYPDGASVLLDVSRALGLDSLGVDLGGLTNAAFVPEGARITRMQDAKGNLSETEVNEWGAVTRVTDVLGRVSRFYRDGSNRVVHSETPAGTSTGPIAASPTGLPQIGASDQLVNEYVWDERGNLALLHEGFGHPRDPISNSILERKTSYVYEPEHNKLVEKTDAEGFVTRWSYDAHGNMTAMTDALGGVMSYAHNAQGLPLTKTDQLGHVTSYAYDTSGNLSRTTDAAGNHFDRFYDAAGNLLLTIDAVGTPIERRRASRYDANNRLVSQTSATGEVTRYDYDSNGNVALIADPAGNVTRRVYDGNNRLLSETTPDAGTNAFTYDLNGNRLTATDASGAITHYAYDSANRLVTLTDALNATRSLSYDLRDNAVSVVNARGKETKLGYDIYKRMNARADPAAGAWPNQYLYQYDRRDNLAIASSPTRQASILYYDALSRLINKDGGALTYDAASNLLSVRGDFGIGYNFGYDALNRRVSSQTNAFPVLLTLTYAYDALSRRTEMRDSQGGVTRYTYDGEDRVASITTPWGGVITQNYDSAGRPQRLAYPNGLDADLSFEAATGRLAGVVHRPGTLGAPIARFDHAYDIRGNLSALTELSGKKTFAYDPVERLTGVTQTIPAPAAEVESYAYDPEGNRLVTHLSPAYVTDDADRVLDDGINAYQWSMDGELTLRTPKSGGVAWRFFHSFHPAENNMRLNLAQASDGKEIGFFYDPFQRLVARHWPSPRGNDELYYDGPDIALELRHPASGAQWVRYVHGPGTDQPLAMEVYPFNAGPIPGTGSQFYYHADGEGSIRLLTNAQGQIANRYDYDSFGRRLSVTESVAQPYGWKGRDFIPGPDIYYNRARFYDPVLGRFMSQDPLGYGAGDANLYSFAWNNPRKWSDPSGLSPAGEYGALAAGALVPAQSEAALGCKLSSLFFHLSLDVQNYQNVKGDSMCGATGVKPIPVHDIDIADNPPDVGEPGNCNDREKDAMAEWYKAVCAPADNASCSGNLTRSENLEIMKLNINCGAAREWARKACWPGEQGDDGHEKRIEKHKNRVQKCLNILNNK